MLKSLFNKSEDVRLLSGMPISPMLTAASKPLYIKSLLVMNVDRRELIIKQGHTKKVFVEEMCSYNTFPSKLGLPDLIIFRQEDPLTTDQKFIEPRFSHRSARVVLHLSNIDS